MSNKKKRHAPLFLFQFTLDFVKGLLQFINFLTYLIVIVLHHRIDEDRVDERHADNTA